MSIRARTYLLVTVPLAGILVLVAWGWIDRSGTLADVSQVVERMNLATKGGELLHAVQLERGLTAGWRARVSEGGGVEASVPSEVAKARDQVDAGVGAFAEDLERRGEGEPVTPLEGEARAFREAVDSLEAVRRRIDQGEVPGAEAKAAYAGFTEALLDVVTWAEHAAAHPDLAGFLEAYGAVVHLKEAAGLERAVLHAALERETLLAGERDAVVGLVERQRVMEEQLAAAREAAQPGRARLEEWEDVARTEAMEVEGLRNALLAEGPDAAGISPDGWFETATRRIDLLHGLERNVLTALEARAAALEERGRWERALFGWAGLGLVLLTLGGATVTVRSICGPLGRLRGQLDRLGQDEGVREAWLDERGPEEVAGIAQAFNAHAGRLRELLGRAEESEAKFAGILETSGDAILSVDEAQRIHLFNRGAEEIFGYAADEVLGEPLDILLPERHREAHRRHVRAFAETLPVRARRMGERDEVAGLRKDGEEFPAEAAIWKLKVGETWMLNVVLRDVTEQRHAEQELARRARELERSNADLEQFAYVASHDLQEPLRMVGSYTQLLARRYQGRLDEDADEFIGYAVDGVNRMREMINDLLTYSRVGRQGGAFERLPLAEALDGARENVKVSVEESGATVSRDDLPTVSGDRVQLTQLFQNLVANAIRFRGEEPPHIHVGAKRPTSGPEGPGWVITVRDNGVGMEPEQIERVFLIFQRLHGRGRYPGTGIGLSIAKKIVEGHGGRIWAESEPGRGSTFHFTLPDGGG